MNLGKRELRLLSALLNGPIVRKETDRVTGASNAPHYVGLLRKRGLIVICERISRTDRDGKPCSSGRCSLAFESRDDAQCLLEAEING